MIKNAKIKIVDNSDKLNIAADTIGRLSRAELALIMGNKNMLRTMSDARATGELDDIKAVVDDYNKKHPEMETTVYLGGAPWTWDRLKDAYKAKGMERKIGNAIAAITDPLMSLRREDHYQGIGDYVTLYAPDKNVLRHELGHALNRSKYKTGIGHTLAKALPDKAIEAALAHGIGRNVKFKPTQFLEESNASLNGLRSIDDDNITEKRLGAAALGAALGTYGSGLVTGLGRLINPELTAKIRNKLLPSFDVPIYTKTVDKLKARSDAFMQKLEETAQNTLAPDKLKDFNNSFPTLKYIYTWLKDSIPRQYTLPGPAMLGAGLTGLAGYLLSGTDWFKNLVSNKKFVDTEAEKVGSLKQGQMEANAAMIKEIAGQGDMERVAPGIDPEVVSAIASILAMEGNGDSQEDMEALLKDNPEIIEEML